MIPFDPAPEQFSSQSQTDKLPIENIGYRRNTVELNKTPPVPAAAGLKFDSEKTRLDLVDPFAIEGLGKVLTFGAAKYAAHNWRNGIEYSRVIGALKRHLVAIEMGEEIDPESGLPHIDHLGCCWMFLSYFMKRKPELNNLPKI